MIQVLNGLELNIAHFKNSIFLLGKSWFSLWQDQIHSTIFTVAKKKKICYNLNILRKHGIDKLLSSIYISTGIGSGYWGTLYEYEYM